MKTACYSWSDCFLFMIGWSGLIIAFAFVIFLSVERWRR